jgi:5-methylcytosine-specific restriction endonuclease McrA
VKERYRTDPAVREHEKARHAATYQRERARILARNRRWRALPGNRDRERESNRRYYETNKRTVQQWHRAYYESNKDAFNAISARRRAHKKAVQSIPFTSEQLADRWAYYGNRCWLCEKPATATDHVKPISKGGAHMLANLRPICKPCNSRKHNKWPYPLGSDQRHSADLSGAQAGQSRSCPTPCTAAWAARSATISGVPWKNDRAVGQLLFRPAGRPGVKGFEQVVASTAQRTF